MIKHLLSVSQLSREDVTRILDTAESFREVGTRVIKKVPALRGRTVVNLFYENSTRTRISFELAAKRLSADVINFSTSGSSRLEGRDPQGHGADAAGDGRRRHRDPALVVRRAAHAVEVGDGVRPERRRRHRTSTRRRRCWTCSPCASTSRLRGTANWRSSATCGIRGSPGRSPSRGEDGGAGDARRAAHAHPARGARRGARPSPTTSTRSCRSWTSATCCASSASGSGSSSSRAFASTRAGTACRASRVDALPERALIMHPGPMNRGVEIASDVADLPRAVITDQVTNGIAVRMSLAVPDPRRRRARGRGHGPEAGGATSA